LSNLAAVRASALASSLEDIGESGDLSDAGLTLAELEKELHRVDRKLQAICPSMVQ
jgi:hypothetical protein